MKKKIILIIGGTGSFGSAVVSRLINKNNYSEIRILSRDEKKQEDFRQSLKSRKVKFFLGDVRDLNSVMNACQNVDHIFHAAALKQVPSCEFYPIEAVKTNVLGTENVLNAAISNDVEKVVCLSTDKASYPINAMGVSKAMMEKVFVAKSRNSKNTIITGTRYGNVMASRGSVIPHFHDQIINGKNITVTEPKMTRFMMTLDHAVELVLFAFNNGQSGDIFVQKSPASTIGDLAIAMKEIYNSDVIIENIGIRHAEKMHETLLSVEERMVSEDLGDYYKVSADNRDLNYNKYFSEGIDSKAVLEEYNSFNTNRLSIQELKDLLGTVGYK